MITIKSEREIELMREAGKMVSMTHQYLKILLNRELLQKS